MLRKESRVMATLKDEEGIVGFRIVHFSPAEVGTHSLVGIGSDSFPLPFGNYFKFLSPDNREASLVERLWGPQVVNMWYENFIHICKEKKIERVRTVLFGDVSNWVVLIEDDNIPKEYLNSTLCFTGSYSTKSVTAQVETYSGLKLR